VAAASPRDLIGKGLAFEKVWISRTASRYILRLRRNIRRYLDILLWNISAANSLGTNMEVDTPEDVAGFKEHFNGAVPIKRAQMNSITTTSDAAQLRKRKEAEKSYGRGRKIPGVYRFPPLCSASSDIDSS